MSGRDTVRRDTLRRDSLRRRLVAVGMATLAAAAATLPSPARAKEDPATVAEKPVADGDPVEDTSTADDGSAEAGRPSTAEQGAKAADTGPVVANPQNGPLAERDPLDTPATGVTKVEGSATIGWRLIHDEGDGRFPQDHALRDGPRIFDAHLLLTDDSRDAAIHEIEARVHGVGEENSDYDLLVRHHDLFEVRGGFRRDDYSYRATGDPFPYDTVRERSWFRGRLTPHRNLTFRLDFERSTRRGDSFVQTDTERRFTAPNGVDVDIVNQRRPLDQRYDTYTVGLDWGDGIWRAGIAESIRVGVVDDERIYDIPRARRDSAEPVREVLERNVRSKTYTTTAKAGVSLFDGDLDLSAFMTLTRAPVDGRISGRADSFDPFDQGGTPRGVFGVDVDGDTRTIRNGTAWRGEALWQALEDVEVIFAAEQDDVVDDAELRLVERRVYERADVDPIIQTTHTKARITDRTDRYSAEVAWDVVDDLRLRGGYEHYTQDVTVPVDTRGGSLEPTQLRSETGRVLFGADVEPVEDLSLSVLARISRNDEPHANTSAERADELIYRGRYKVSRAWNVSAVYRTRGAHRSDRFDASSRSESWTVSSDWTSEAWYLSGSASYQDVETRTATHFIDFQGANFGRTRDTIRFDTRDLVLNLYARHDITSNTRALAEATYVRSRGDYGARYHDFALGAEHDLDDSITVGIRARVWRFDEDDSRIDDYTAEALEFSLTYRF